MKKYLLSLIVLSFTISASAQCKYIKNEVDEFTGNKKIVLNISPIGNSKLIKLQASMSAIDTLKYIHLYMNADYLGCVSSESYAIFKFLDGTTLRLFHAGKINCKTPIMALKLSEEDIKKFESSTVDKIRISLSESSEDVTLSNNQYFINGLKCLTPGSQ